MLSTYVCKSVLASHDSRKANNVVLDKNTGFVELPYIQDTRYIEFENKSSNLLNGYG